MSMTASARPVRGTLRHEVDVNGRHTVFTDEPERLGGEDSAAAPHELLPATLAACVSTMLAVYARQRGWSIDGLAVNVVYDSDVTPRHASITVQLPDDLTDEQVERLRRVVRGCPVRRALEAGFTLDERIVAHRGGPDHGVGAPSRS